MNYLIIDINQIMNNTALCKISIYYNTQTLGIILYNLIQNPDTASYMSVNEIIISSYKYPDLHNIYVRLTSLLELDFIRFNFFYNISNPANPPQELILPNAIEINLRQYSENIITNYI